MDVLQKEKDDLNSKTKDLSVEIEKQRAEILML
jgi:hypothetical protein